MEGEKGKNSAWVGKHRILVNSWTGRRRSDFFCPSGRVKSEFFVVDLKQQMIVTKHPKAVWSDDYFKSTAVLHKGTLSVLNIGVRNFTNSGSTPIINEQDYIHSSDSDTCISTLDLKISPPIWSNWTPGPKMIFQRKLPYCAVLHKIIFACRGTNLNSKNPELYKLNGCCDNNKWEETTIPFGGDLSPYDPAWISLQPISDPNNDRLIVYFGNTNSLYAYCYHPPNNNYWKLLHLDLSSKYFLLGASVIANQVVGDRLILCFDADEQIFTAYDIFTNSWLNVVSLINNKYLMYFDDRSQLVHLGNDILCLATSSREPPSHKTLFQFLRFSVKFVQEEQLVQLTYLSFHPIFMDDIYCRTGTFIPF